MQSRTAAVHSLLAPLTDTLNLRMMAPPRTIPRTASGMPTPPERDGTVLVLTEVHPALSTGDGLTQTAVLVRPTYHHVGERHRLSELLLDELGHEGGETRQQRRQVHLGQNHQQVDGSPQSPHGDNWKT